MAKVLGLDLGTSSIGWALIDDEKKEIIRTGVRIFQEGVENLGEGENEISRNAARRMARGMRRQTFRRRLRKLRTLKLLREYGMAPAAGEDLKPWFRMNPYALRSRALDEKLDLMEVGRLFYHMAQRRGFLSNSRRAAATEEGTIFEGGEGKVGINETQQFIGDKTLGSYLYSIYPPENEPFRQGLPRTRNRYTTRKMYIEEFERIWNAQEPHHPALNAEAKALIGGRKEEGYPADGVLFFQRPLRSQKHTVGQCTFEPAKKRCPKSHPLFEEFRAWQFANGIECNGKKLTDEEREKIVRTLLTSVSLSAKDEKIEFKRLHKAIGKLDAAFKFNYQGDDKIPAAYTVGKLSNKLLFGSRWFDLSAEAQANIWHTLYSIDDIDKLERIASERWGLNDEAAMHVSKKIHLKDGYASLSLKALRNILPFLKTGFTYDVAVALGGVKNAFGPAWDQLSEAQKEFIVTNVPEIIASGMKGGFIGPLRDFLGSEFHLDQKHLNRLYHHSATLEAGGHYDLLPTGPKADAEIGMLRNPVVIQSLFELRRVVNDIIKCHGKPDKIKVELARDLKLPKMERNRIRIEQKRLERENDRIKAELDRHGQRHTHENLLKYRLWEECQHKCPYTGKEISLTQLFSGEVEIEHIIPYSRSLDDSYGNKTLCFAKENREKGDRTPYEYGVDTKQWDVMKSRALSLFYDSREFPGRYRKFKKFALENIESLEGFVQRQLNDTRYASRESRQYLRKVCTDVQGSPGGVTARLRYMWGVNNILNPDGEEKTRDDHRHHAVDALVLACHHAGHLQQISKWNRYRRDYDLRNFPMPWVTFRRDAERSIGSILVSHKKTKRAVSERTVKTEKNGQIFLNKGSAARGQMHKESVYGRRTPPASDAGYHIRKPLESLTDSAQVMKIVDKRIRQLVLDRIAALGEDISQPKFKVPKGAFFEVDPETKEKRPLLYLPNRNGQRVPILKVRIAEKLGNAEMVKPSLELNQYVNPRNNHHVLIYEDQEGNLKEQVVTLWEAVERKRQGMNIVMLPEDGVRIVTTLQINDMFILNMSDEEFLSNLSNGLKLRDHLYRVQKLSSRFYEFRWHTEAKLDNNYQPYYIRINSMGYGKTGWKSFNPIKVRLSASGLIVPEMRDKAYETL